MEIELKSELIGIIRGVPCVLQPYRARLVDGFILQVGQPFKNGTTGWMGGWRLRDLVLGGDELYLDFGQEWKVRGMWKVLEEALTHVQFEFKTKKMI